MCWSTVALRGSTRGGPPKFVTGKLFLGSLKKKAILGADAEAARTEGTGRHSDQSFGQ